MNILVHGFWFIDACVSVDYFVNEEMLDHSSACSVSLDSACFPT